MCEKIVSTKRLWGKWDVEGHWPNVRRTSRNLRKTAESVKQYWNSVSMGTSSTSSMTGISKCVWPEQVPAALRPAIHKPTSLMIPCTSTSHHTHTHNQIIRLHDSSIGDAGYCNRCYCSVVCRSVIVSMKPLNGMTCHLAGTFVWFQVNEESY